MSYEADSPYEKDNWHSSHRWKARKSSGRQVFKYCRKHDRVEKAASRCFHTESRRPDAPSVVTFKPFWHEQLDSKPVYIESKAQLKRECEKRNLVSLY